MGYINKAYNMYNELTNKYMKEKSKSQIKKLSQYFTPHDIADSLFTDVIVIKKDIIEILDTCCGNGILLLKLIEKILSNYIPKEICIYAFDIDPILIENVASILEHVDVNNHDTKIKSKLYSEDYLNSDIDTKFDYIVMNPPYKKVNIVDVPYNLRGVIIGQPNMYHLFIAKALNELNGNGVLCILSPKNYLSGRYTEKLRKKIVTDYSVYKIHTFNNRRTFFDIKITQEVCIVHITRKHHKDIMISYNGNAPIKLPFKKLILDPKTNIIQTPRDMNDYALIDKFSNFPKGIIGRSIYMKTGKVVQFRVRKELLSERKYRQIKHGVPLIVYRHINSGKFTYSELINKKKNRAISIYNNGATKSILIDNRNYVLLRKNTDKKYDKLISCVPYMKYLDTDKLGIDNGLAYLTNCENNLTNLEVKGIECILMSKQFDDYYRMVNSSHTLNVYEFENLHFPDMDTIRQIGADLSGMDVTSELATRVMEKYL